jgi:hypothetical protein
MPESAIQAPVTNRARWRGYVTMFCCLSGGIVGLLSGLNYAVDPYLIHQWNSPALQRLRPVREKLSAWGKTYAIAKLKPTVVYIGNSRTEAGLPVRSSVFAGKTVFNGALSGASLGDGIAMAGYASRMSRLDSVVWGIDVASFSLEVGSNELEPELIAEGPFLFFRRALSNLKRGLTLDMTADSLRVLSGSFGAVCRSSLAYYGQRDEECISHAIASKGGTMGVMAPRLREFVAVDGLTGAALDALEASVSRLCRGGTQVRLYINPTHALTLDALYWSGKWAAMEDWQRALAAMSERRRAAGCDVRIYDFSGYNSITTEPIPQVTRRQEMDNYWEASHYRRNVGHMILGRMFGGVEQGVPSDFGVELGSAMLPAHLAEMRALRDRYHLEHAQETTFVKAIAVASMAKPDMLGATEASR